MADIQPGTTVAIASDIVVDGVVAFGRGEQVVVERVSPNPADPRYKYVVVSASLGKRYQLKDDDIVAPYMEPPTQAEPPVFAAPGQPPPPPPGVQPAGPATTPAPVAGGRPSRERKGGRQARAPREGGPPRPRKAPREKSGSGGGLKVLTVLLLILLIAAMGAGGYLWYKSNDTKKKDKAKIESLEKQVSTLNKQIKGKTQSTSPQSTLPGQSTQPQTPGTAPSSTPNTPTTAQPSDEQSLKSLTSARYPGREIGLVQILDDWARVDLKGSPSVQGEQVFYHKINGTWTYVAAGTGLGPSDIPGCPPQLFD